MFGHELPSPFLFVQEDDAVGLVGNRLNRALYDASPGPLFTVQVIGASHLNFSDLALFSPLLGLKNLLGPAEGTQVLAQTNRFLVAFFDRRCEVKAHLCSPRSLKPQGGACNFVYRPYRQYASKLARSPRAGRSKPFKQSWVAPFASAEATRWQLQVPRLATAEAEPFQRCWSSLSN